MNKYFKRAFNFILIVSLIPLSFSNTIWLVSEDDHQSFGEITGVTDSGKKVNFNLPVYNGRHVELAPGYYFLKIRNPNLEGLSFDSKKQYVVRHTHLINDQQCTNKKLVTIQYKIKSVPILVNPEDKNLKVSFTIPTEFTKTEEDLATCDYDRSKSK